MGRPLTPRLYTIRELIKEVVLFINEIFDKIIPTEYKVIPNIKYDDTVYDQYPFSVNSGQKYEVDFFSSLVDLNIIRPIPGLRRIEIDGILYQAGSFVNIKEKRKFLFFSWPVYKCWKIDVICKNSTAILSNGDNQKIITGTVQFE